jgi:hypothetical protein
MLVSIESSMTPSVPKSVRERALVARNLILYSWFCYDFCTVSIFWSYSCIEMGLRKKYSEQGTHGNKRKDRSFKFLLDWAMREGLLKDGKTLQSVRMLRNSMAHPEDFNTVLFPGHAFDSFALMVEILSALWPN